MSSFRNLFSVFDVPVESFIVQAEKFRLDEVKAPKHEFMFPYYWRSVFRNKTLGCIFGEPSIRTRWSFESAMQKMGGNVVSSFGPQSTSAEKGESLEDMLKTASQFVDAIVVRTPEPLIEMDEILINLDGIDAHIINAGDGKNEHPTQAMLDAYTIWRNFQRLNSLRFVVVGDVSCSRTIH